jgi:hypothetical protein
MNLARCTANRCPRNTSNSHPIRDFKSKCSRICVRFADFITIVNILFTDVNVNVFGSRIL